MKRNNSYLILMVVISVFFLASCTQERLFTESKYNYLKKVPAESITTEIAKSTGTKDNVTSQMQIQEPCENNILTNPVRQDSLNILTTGKLNNNSLNGHQKRLIKLSKRIDRLINKTNLTETIANDRLTKSAQQPEKKKTFAGRILQKVKNFLDVPPEKLLLWLLVIALALFLIILLHEFIIDIFIIILLAILLIALIHYLY
jgi:hypothetical protein